MQVWYLVSFWRTLGEMLPVPISLARQATVVHRPFLFKIELEKVLTKCKC
jgi:hypothetical protein